MLVISYACWQTRLNGDPNVIGRLVHINTYPYTILGVAPPGFRGTEIFYPPEIWLPASMQPQIDGHSVLEERKLYTFWVAGRLKRGISVAAIGQELIARGRRIHFTTSALLGQDLLVPNATSSSVGSSKSWHTLRA